MKKLFSLLIFGLLSLAIYAREVYCLIVGEETGVRIIPNKEYLTDAYWDYITKDLTGHDKVFPSIDHAVNELANFGWYVVKTETNDSIKIIMGHKIDNNMEIKSSREKMIHLMEQ